MTSSTLRERLGFDNSGKLNYNCIVNISDLTEDFISGIMKHLHDLAVIAPSLGS